MVETILLAMIIAKLKGYKIKPLFKSWTIYPLLVLEVITAIGQVTIFNGNYDFIKVVGLLKVVYLSAYLFLIFKYEVYKSAILGSIFMICGGMLNDIAIKANGRFMPVFPSLSYFTGYAKKEAFDLVNDIHILGNTDTKVKFLTDFIDLGYSILSVGDILIRVFVFLIIYNSIKKSNSS
ncbi:DUF5317 domain-containing protein [Clostridium cadaveris]|uniref:DUF5317 family protein n=1 Tax=Clostridium cadaveris TaxID=1529 RepID=UPI001E52C55E|nr:DUF5317 family protein [Clostridium cadaveris]UFH66031.1 DUF5317 domain-containing protein [Clostridium cadaveris]